MASQQIRIEIVPFPDPDPSPGGSAPRSGLTPVDTPVDVEAREPEVGPDVEPDLDPDDELDEAAPEPERELEPDAELEEPEPEAELDEAEPAPEPDAEAALDEKLDEELEGEADVEAALEEPESDDADAEPEAVLDAEPEAVLDDVEAEADARLDEPDDQPGDESGDESEPEEPEAALGELEADPDEDDPGDSDPEAETAVAVPGARASRRRAADLIEPVPPRPVVEAPKIVEDDSTLRSSTISGRLLFLTLGAVVVAAVVVLTSIWGIARVSAASRDLAAIGRAEDLSSAAIAELRVLERTDDGAVDDARRYESVSADAVAAARSWAPTEATKAVADASTAYAGARAGGAADAADEYRAAFDAQTTLHAELRRSELAAVDRSEATRTSAIASVLVLFALGSIGLVLLGRSIGRSVVVPLRILGRNLRRFGDGDLRSRAPIAPDEVGTLARSFNVMAESVSERVRRLNADAERDSQLRMVSDALDLADRETDVYRILERALGILTPENPGELLVNEPTSTRLWQVSANPTSGAAGCPVETAEGCVAMRRAQAVVFDSPSAINACPQLRNHESPCSAACVPVGVNGHLLGVVHVTAPEHEPPEPEVVEQLVTLAGQVGVRVGAMRTLETTRLQASTDGLTGLANRRMLEARLGDLLRGQVSFALAVADLDEFSQLNNNFGHETGDRALQLFAKVLEDNVRGHDVVARYGGEEFVLVYPELSVTKAMEVIERIRHAMERAIEAHGLPPFTCSFGVTHSSAADSVDAIIRIADAGLLMAKDLGRNRVVFADLELAAEVFGGHAAAVEPVTVDLADDSDDADVTEVTEVTEVELDA